MGASRIPEPRGARAKAVLTPGLAALCDFTAAMAVQHTGAARAAIVRARAARRRRVHAEECGLMLMLYAGFPAALEGLRVLHDVWPGRAQRTREGGPARWRARGEALCRRVYGPAYAKLLPAVQALHPDLAVYMVEHGYGRVLARAGLSARERELLTVAALAALGWERQLISHLLGSLRVGAPRDAVAAALERGLAQASPAAATSGRQAWKRLTALDAGALAARTGRRRH